MLTLARQQQRQNIRWLLCLSVLMLLALLLSLCAGELWILRDWFSPRGELFVWQIRLPRTLAVLLVGAALAISGAVMQALFENPLAELDYLASLTAQAWGLSPRYYFCKATPQLGARACVRLLARLSSLLYVSPVVIFRPVGYCWLALHWGLSVAH